MGMSGIPHINTDELQTCGPWCTRGYLLQTVCTLFGFPPKKKKKWVIVLPKSCDWNIMWWLTLSQWNMAIMFEQVDQICPVHCSSCKYTEVKVSVRMFTPLLVWMCGGLGRIQFTSLLYNVFLFSWLDVFTVYFLWRSSHAAGTWLWADRKVML